MNVKNLKELIADLPDAAVVYVMADHGQSPERGGFVDVTAAEELPYYGEDLDWDEEIAPKDVTAVMIS